MAGAIAPSLHIPPPERAPDRECVPDLLPDLASERAAPPLELRSARPEDRAPAWCLQRAAFDLPPHGPPPHPGSHDELRVAVTGGKVVSCLTLVYADFWMWGAPVPVGGIRHVATDPEEQNRGYASALMRDTLQHLRRQGVATSALFPFSFRYYRKFGYELGGNHCHFWCRPSCIPAYSEARLGRRAGPAEASRLAGFCREQAATTACSLARDERRWRALLEDPELQVLVADDGGPLLGYAVTTEDRDRCGGRVLRVLDLEARSPAGWRALLGRLAGCGAESVEWLARGTDVTASGLLRSAAPLREGFKPRGIITVRPMFQFRVVDLEGALHARVPAFPSGHYRLAIRLRDELLPENTVPLAVHGTPDGAAVRPARPSDPYLEAEVRLFSQLYCGYMSVADAVSQDLVRCSSPAALETAELLFPPGEPFIAELDRF